MMIIRETILEEANELSKLALLSKATWDYSTQFLATCKEDLTITEAYIKNNYVYVLENAGVTIGFFHLYVKIEIFLIFSIYIRITRGKGMEKMLWKAVVEKAIELGITCFIIESDPNAKGYYMKMGAKLIGETPSTVLKGRSLPLLQYDV
ncbi:GNAT family N-acetyltransferase [Bacillus cytotoxicus]